MKGENRLRRVLGPVTLTSLGVGAIIGAGIFVLTGEAAADKAGPGADAVVSSSPASTCIFAALCYAEFASMVPVAGSAYTYAYATLGELFAWIIGWDLVLEYAVGVGDGGQRLVALLPGRAGRSSASTLPEGLQRTRPFDYDPTLGDFVATGGVLQPAGRSSSSPS